jgi:transposase-like protein
MRTPPSQPIFDTRISLNEHFLIHLASVNAGAAKLFATTKLTFPIECFRRRGRYSEALSRDQMTLCFFELLFSLLGRRIGHLQMQTRWPNIVEQDHRAIKRITRPMLGFKSFRCARILLAGIETIDMIRKRQLAGSNRSTSDAANQFYALAY